MVDIHSSTVSRTSDNSHARLKAELTLYARRRVPEWPSQVALVYMGVLVTTGEV